MSFSDILRAHAAAYPRMDARDLCKLCYQAEFGGGHLLLDPDKARELLEREYDEVLPQDEPFFTPVGGGHSRLSLSAARAEGIPTEIIFALFSASATVCGPPEGFERRADDARELVLEGALDISPDSLELELDAIRASGYAPVSHSETYRRSYAPAYRVVDSRYAPLLPLIARIHERLPLGYEVGAEVRAPLVISLDGMAGAGKSSAAELLSRLWKSSVVHTDDFFLPPSLRTPERFALPGGNIHYERLRDEVTSRLDSTPFSYRVFDCSRMDYNGSLEITRSPLIIVEGSYSAHPQLGKYADLRAFVAVSPDEQLRRITKRNGAATAENFRQRWIPLENAYFDFFNIRENSDVVADTSEPAL